MCLVLGGEGPLLGLLCCCRCCTLQSI
jgi:hypothetical protein